LADPNPSAQTPLHTLSLSDVLASHSEEYLSRNLTSLRKEIFTSLIDPVLTSKHTAVHIDSQNESISFDLSNSSSSQSHPFDSLRTLVSFLSQNLIAVLPTTLGSQFSSQLFQYLSTSILTLLLKPSIPNSQDSLPSFLSLATEAVNFESELAELGARTKDVTEWAVSLPTHYERKRRQDILETARRLVESRVEADKEGVRIELEESVPEPTTAEGKKPEASPFVSGSSLPDSDNAFASAGEDAWGFEEEVEPEPPTKEVKAETDPEPEADGWGWDESAPNDNNPAEDDPWDDP
jgi:centromere/kinetochore protein ZW10